MPLSGDADQLAKSFHQHLHSVEQRKKIELGWYDFLRSDHPETEDPVEMAQAALEYIGLTSDGAWCGDDRILVATIAFLKERLSVYPSDSDAAELLDLLEQRPVDRGRLTRWFESVYRPPGT
jgi:hypothetical protein